MSYRHAWLAVLLLAVGIGSVQAQQRRTITGRVTDDTGKPVPGAQVTIKGTNTGALGKQDGTFSVSAPATDVTLVVQFIGFKRVEVPVAAGRNSVNVSMKTDVLNLDEIVVTGQATGIQRRNLANAIAKVNASELVKAPSATVTNALMGKVAGAQIYSNSGAPGGGVRVRLRGITSINGASQPLYVIDGVILSDVAIAPGTNIVTGAGARTNVAVESQETPVNRIADLNPNDIESVEVLKGAAASAIYGSKASNGVIVITTKRGKPGATTYSIRQGIGTSANSYKQGSRTFTSLADAIDAFGANAAKYWQPGVFYDHEAEILQNKPFNYETVAGLSGGSENTRYYASFNNKHEGGVVTNTYSDKQDMRLNVDQQVGKRLTLRLNTEVLHNASDRGLFNNDNTGSVYYFILSKMPSFWNALNDDGTYREPDLPGFVANHLQSVQFFKNRETVWRSVASGTADLTLVNSDVHTLKLLATGGADVLNQKNVVLSPPNLFYEDDDGLLGTSGTSFGQNINLNLNLNAVHSFKPRGGLFAATTSAGLQLESRSLDISRVAGQGLLGATNFDIATVTTTDQERKDVRDLGFFAQEEVIFRERLMLTAGIRGDRSSNNGDPAAYFFYPKAAASYRIPNLKKGVIDELKVRAAYGQSGNQPLFGQKFTQLNTNIISGNGGFTLPTQAGADKIVPERQAESEGGIDAALFDGRANLELTTYQKVITDLLLNRTLAPTTGFGNEFFNGGKLRVRGFEAVGTLSPLRGAFQWTSRVNYAMNRTRLMELPVPTYLISSPTTGALNIQVGHPVTELWGNDTITGPHPDLSPSCAATAPTGLCVYPHKIGDENPKYTMGLSNEFTFKGFRFYTLFDGQSGGMQAAGTWRHYDLGKNSVDYDQCIPGVASCSAVNDPGKKGVNRVANYRNVTAVFFQDISFIKLREATIGYDIPIDWVTRLRLPARSARISLSGRELKTWTNYRGGDPEYNTFYAGTTALQVNRELMAYPSSRSFWMNLDFTF
jgi:TonB-linked SusC/RagA family outer membrane protein